MLTAEMSEMLKTINDKKTKRVFFYYIVCRRPGMKRFLPITFEGEKLVITSYNSSPTYFDDAEASMVALAFAQKMHPDWRFRTKVA